MHRSIVIHMERAPRTVRLTRFDRKQAEQAAVFDAIYRVVYQWSRDCILDLDPPMPRELHNRRAENWRVLIAIADACGHGEMAREAAVALSEGHQDEDPIVELLMAWRDVFDTRRVDRLASADIVADLVSLEDAPWSEWRGIRGDQQPRKLSQAELARLLRPFRIFPKTIWPLGTLLAGLIPPP
jgi:uncharacterized protein with von Willebrand factor type A (vWA) domain